MKELDNFTVERLEEIRNSFLDRIQESAPSLEEVFALIDIALAAKRAEPVINIKFKDGWPVPESVGVVDAGKKLADGYHDFYTTPQLNSPEIPEGWKGTLETAAKLIDLCRTYTILGDTGSYKERTIDDCELTMQEIESYLAAAPEKPL
ncbi:hypothetical protein [Yersinia bercovieri]|uniref:hypothetical protein n=1 Tax=Yersinia bercovieri TaxID=634 RepID=UPI0005DBAA9F|nr:hypothetical protein [Yersinia bercovieri]CNI60737.1 Uncharacterised protein [Yersinia bercovieri]